MNRQNTRNATTPSGIRVSYHDDAGDPKHQILFSSLQIEAKQKREPDTQESFHELLEKLSSAHETEIRSRMNRLEFEKADLERQNKALRSQLVESRLMSSGSDQLQMRRGARRERAKTSPSNAAGASPLESEERAKLPALPSLVEVPDCDGASSRDRDPAGCSGDSEKDGEGAAAETPKGREEHFPPRSEYTKELGDTLDSTTSSSPSKSAGVTRSSPVVRNSISDVSHEEPFKTTKRRSYESFMASYIASPRSYARTAWELVGFVLVVWDLVTVPLAVFCYPVNDLTVAMEWITLVFWTLNIPQTLTVGYEGGLGEVMSPLAVLVRYLRSWFLIDMLVLVPDWTIVLVGLGSSKELTTSCESAVDGTEELKLLRKLRVMRLLRLTRIARLKKLWQLVKDRVYSLTVNIVVNIVNMLLLLLVLCHFISCLWYLISQNTEGDYRWLAFYDMEGSDWGYLYATCLHWSLTQFTPAPMNIQPQNLPERAFNISVVVCALVGFSYVVGSITGNLAQLRSVTEEESKLFWDLRVYLRRNAVEHTLAVRIQRYLSHAWRYQACNKTFSQIKILTMLSEQLQNELLFQLHSEHLNVYPLIKTLLDVSTVTVFRLARTAISTKQCANEDPIFIYGEKPSHMYIVIQGRFVYRRVTSEGREEKEMVDKGEDWIAEPVLWSTEWHHLGDCTAVGTSSLTLVNPHHFCQEAMRNPLAWSLVTTYCRNFLKWLNSTSVDELSDVTQGDHEDKKAQLKNFMATGLHPNVAARAQLTRTFTRSSTMQRFLMGKELS